MPRTFISSASLTTACLAAACFAPPVLAQGALKPVEALIVNPPSRPVPVQVLSAPMPAGEGSRTPYNLPFTQVLFPGGGNACTSSTQPITLPAGKRLVLKHLSATASLPAPAAMSYVAVGLVKGGVGTGFVIVVPAAPPLPFTEFGGGQRNLSAAGQQVHAYIDDAFQLCVVSQLPNNGSATVQLSGYLVDKP